VSREGQGFILKEDYFLDRGEARLGAAGLGAAWQGQARRGEARAWA